MKQFSWTQKECVDKHYSASTRELVEHHIKLVRLFLYGRDKIHVVLMLDLDVNRGSAVIVANVKVTDRTQLDLLARYIPKGKSYYAFTGSELTPEFKETIITAIEATYKEVE